MDEISGAENLDWALVHPALVPVYRELSKSLYLTDPFIFETHIALYLTHQIGCFLVHGNWHARDAMTAEFINQDTLHLKTLKKYMGEWRNPWTIVVGNTGVGKSEMLSVFQSAITLEDSEGRELPSASQWFTKESNLTLNSLDSHMGGASGMGTAADTKKKKEAEPQGKKPNPSLLSTHKKKIVYINDMANLVKEDSKDNDLLKAVMDLAENIHKKRTGAGLSDVVIYLTMIANTTPNIVPLIRRSEMFGQRFNFTYMRENSKEEDSRRNEFMEQQRNKAEAGEGRANAVTLLREIVQKALDTFDPDAPHHELPTWISHLATYTAFAGQSVFVNPREDYSSTQPNEVSSSRYMALIRQFDRVSVLLGGAAGTTQWNNRMAHQLLSNIDPQLRWMLRNIYEVYQSSWTQGGKLRRTLQVNNYQFRISTTKMWRLGMLKLQNKGKIYEYQVAPAWVEIIEQLKGMELNLDVLFGKVGNDNPAVDEDGEAGRVSWDEQPPESDVSVEDIPV